METQPVTAANCALTGSPTSPVPTTTPLPRTPGSRSQLATSSQASQAPPRTLMGSSDALAESDSSMISGSGASSEDGWGHVDGGSGADDTDERDTAARPSQGRLALWLRKRVSQKKRRFREDGFDLDLSYITPRIIAMGYPAHGKEYYLRNPIDHVEAFFEARHAGHYRIYNLCSERQYDAPTRFRGNFRRYPFDDHNTPSLQLMLDFVADAAAFLREDASNVVGIHCKAGRGRTGVMISCLLRAMYPSEFPTAADAVHYFDTHRTHDGCGVTIPSQLRYVGYFERLLIECRGVVPAPRRMRLYHVIVSADCLHSLANPHDFYFSVWVNNIKTVRSKQIFPEGPATGKVGCVFVFPDPTPVLCGDIKFLFHKRKSLINVKSPPPCFYMWVNTTFCEERIILRREDLDKVDKSIPWGDLCVEVLLHAEEDETKWKE